VLGGVPGEQLLAGEDVRGGELLAVGGDLDVRAVDGAACVAASASSASAAACSRAVRMP
jgi:hypothetical protein